MPTVAVVIIGDEILTGKFADENGPFLVRRLRELGADLRRIAVIGDAVADIADEVARCARAYDHVITTGGVGPTHDDRTFEGIAAAFDEPLELRAELAALLDRHGMERSPANLRMATVPRSAVLTVEPDASFPVTRVHNVWVLPGVPRLMQTKFQDVAHHFAGTQVLTAKLRCRQSESRIAETLAAAQVAFPQVSIGSYPRWGEAEFRVLICLDTRDAEALAHAVRSLRADLDIVQPDPARSDEPR